MFENRFFRVVPAALLIVGVVLLAMAAGPQVGAVSEISAEDSLGARSIDELQAFNLFQPQLPAGAFVKGPRSLSPAELSLGADPLSVQPLGSLDERYENQLVEPESFDVSPEALEKMEADAQRVRDAYYLSQ